MEMSGCVGDLITDVQMTSSSGNFPVWGRGFWMLDKFSRVRVSSRKSLALLFLWYFVKIPRDVANSIEREKSKAGKQCC